MLNPSMNQLLSKVSNRYLLVNFTARRARDIALNAQENGKKLMEKPVKLALDDIMNDKIQLIDPKPEESEKDGE